jgi:hypothetical protein
MEVGEQVVGQYFKHSGHNLYACAIPVILTQNDDPPRCCKSAVEGRIVCENVSGLFVELGSWPRSHAPVLITAIGLAGQFWVQAEGASFDCSAMLLCSTQTVD